MFSKSINYSFLMMLLISTSCSAEDYYWHHGYNRFGVKEHFADPLAACKSYYYENLFGGVPHPVSAVPGFVADNIHIEFVCWSDGYPFVKARLEGDSCPDGFALDPVIGRCESPSNLMEGRQLGAPDSDLSCAGNPINISNGNKFQVEQDFSGKSLGFNRYYNSISGTWSSSYDMELMIQKNSIALINFDGKRSLFSITDSGIYPEGTELGSITRTPNGWKYTSADNNVYEFDDSGRLAGVIPYLGIAQTVTGNIYSAQRISTPQGEVLEVFYTKTVPYLPMRIISGNIEINYLYDSYSRLVSANKVTNGVETKRIYHYEDGPTSQLLTGITDERGIRLSTWSYDEQGRAISSEHANGSDKTTISYADNYTTVKNALGKIAKYNYQIFSGVRRTISVEGEASENCPASNSTYTYDQRGQVKTVTDKKGVMTVYEYDDRGRETSRTEAANTAFARTTKLTWLPGDFRLISSIAEPTIVTTYEYDTSGRPTKVTNVTESDIVPPPRVN